MTLRNFRRTRIKWDRASNKINQPVRVSSSDENGRILEVQVLDGGSVVDVTGISLNLSWKTEGGHYMGLDAFEVEDASTGLYYIYYTTEMLSHQGTLVGNLQLVDTIGTVSSEPFDITVFKGLDGEGVQSSNSFTALTKALSYVSNIEGLLGGANSLKAGLEARIDTHINEIRGEVGTVAGASSSAIDKVDNLDARVTRETAEIKSQIASLLSSTVTETGDNSYGKWVKRADGTMECTMRVKIKGKLLPYGELFYNYVDPRTVTFPQRFEGVPTLSFSADSYNWFFATGATTSTYMRDVLGYRSTSGSALDETSVTITAHGYWSNPPAKGFALQDTARYPDYWASHLNSKITQAKEYQSVGRDSFSFGFITDMHMEGNTGHSFGLVRDVVDKVGINTVVNGGDQANNAIGAVKARTVGQIEDMLHGFSPIHDKLLNVMGNHDDNSISRIWTETMKHDELYSRLFRYLGNEVTYGPSGKYFYKDDVFNKVRHVILDSVDIPYIKSGTDLKYRGIHEFAYRQEQLNWFADEALDTPDNWNVVVFSHTPPHRGDMVGFDYHTRNADLARGILKAYKVGGKYKKSSTDVESEFTASVDVDFTNKGGDVIAWFAGHTHTDNVITMPEGIPLITTLNDSAKPWGDAPKRTRGTTTEHAFDIVTVNKTTRKINLTRVGAGKDRVVSY